MSKELPTRASKEDRRLINDRIAREEAEEITREQGIAELDTLVRSLDVK